MLYGIVINPIYSPLFEVLRPWLQKNFRAQPHERSIYIDGAFLFIDGAHALWQVFTLVNYFLYDADSLWYDDALFVYADDEI